MLCVLHITTAIFLLFNKILIVYCHILFGYINYIILKKKKK